MRLLACLIVAPQRGYDEPAILSYEISSFCPTSADGLQSPVSWAYRHGYFTPKAQKTAPSTQVIDPRRRINDSGCLRIPIKLTLLRRAREPGSGSPAATYVADAPKRCPLCHSRCT